MVLISLDCSNMVANIIKIFETCKLFWPASEDFVNFATVFVNSATPRGRAPGPPRLSFSLAQRKELKETFPQPRPAPEGRMQPLLLVALYTKVRLGIIALACIILMGRCPIKNPSAWSVRREYLLINDGLRPEGDIVCVALERLAVGHAEQQTGLGVINGVVVYIHAVGNGCHALAVEYRLLIA